MLVKFISLLFLILSFESLAQNVNAQNTSSEEWSDSDTWVGGTIPGCFDTIFIPAGILVEIDVTVDLTGCSGVVIVLEGEMTFNTGKKLLLFDGSQVIVGDDGVVSSGNGGGNSNYIEIGGQVVWSAGDPDITEPITLEEPTPLSVGLIHYEAFNSKRNDVVIEWETYYETNNSHFEIERKLGDASWVTVDVKSAALNGTITNFYRTVDQNLANGQYYYRVVQFDTDGTKTVFSSKSIQIGDESNYIIGKYNLLGQAVDENYKGIVIVLYKNGTSEKIYQ